MFILCYLSSGLEVWSVNHNSIHENFELKVVIFNDWPNDLLGTNVYNTLESCW